MDKHEFNIKVEQIKKMANKGDYETAMKIADGIDWRRVRNASLLSLIAQIYEKNEDYQDAKDILLMAFERAPVGKRLLYKLTDLALKEGSITEAEAYYREFCDLAQDDPRQYLLRYLILKAKGAPVDQLIRSLETYTSVEVDEKWLYELAELYHRANMETECVHTCDRIMLLFGLGQYVDKAMDLKLQYAPLSKYQMDLVENRDKYEAKLKAVEEEYSGSPSYQRGGGNYGQEAYDASSYGEEPASGTRYEKGQYVRETGGASYDRKASYGAGAGSRYTADAYGGSQSGQYTSESYQTGQYDPGYGPESYQQEPYSPESYQQGQYSSEPYPQGQYGSEPYPQGQYGSESYPQGQYSPEPYQQGAHTRESYAQGGYTSEGYQQGSYGQGAGTSGYSGAAYGQNGTWQGNFRQDGYPGGGRGQDSPGGYAGEGYSQDGYGDGTYAGAGYGQTAYAGESYGQGQTSDDAYAGRQYAKADYAPNSYTEPGYDEEAYGNYAANGAVDDDVVLRLHEDAQSRKLAREMSRISEEDSRVPEEETDRYATRLLDDIRTIKEIRPTKRILEAETGREAVRPSTGQAERERQRRAIQAAKEREEMELEALRRAEEEREKERRAEAERRARKQAEIDRERSQREEIHVTMPPEEDEEPGVKTPETYHLMIGAENPGDGVETAIEELRQIHRELGYKTPVAKTSSEKLNRRGISAVAAKLAGKDLVIEQAAGLTDAVQNELDDLMEKDRSGMIVVLIDTPQKLQLLHERNTSLADKFQYISADEKAGRKRITETIVEQALKEETQAQEKIARDVESTLPEETEPLPGAAEEDPASAGPAAKVRPVPSETKSTKPRIVPLRQKAESLRPEESGREDGRYLEESGQKAGSRYPAESGREEDSRYPEESGQEDDWYPAASGQEDDDRYPAESGQEDNDRYPEESGQRDNGRYPAESEQEEERRYMAASGREAANAKRTRKHRHEDIEEPAAPEEDVEEPPLRTPKKGGLFGRKKEDISEPADVPEEEPGASLNDTAEEEYEAGHTNAGVAGTGSFDDFDDDMSMDTDEFAQYARQYASDIDCSIDEKGFNAIYDRAEMMEEDGIPLTRQAAVDLIEAAADKAEKPSLGKKITGLFSPKYNKDGYLILRENHFFD